MTAKTKFLCRSLPFCWLECLLIAGVGICRLTLFNATSRNDVLKESAFETAADWSVSHGRRFRANIMKSTKVQTLGGIWWKCWNISIENTLACIRIIGERSEPHTYRTVGKNLRHIYIYVFYIYIYIYTFVRRARAVNARATRKRRTGRLRFNGQYNRLENGYFSSKL